MTHHDQRGQRASGVDVELAETEFAALSRQLSSESQHRTLDHRRDAGTDVIPNGHGDLEKGNGALSKGGENKDSEEPFDLETVLRGAKDEDEEAGVKSKRIGVLWDNLTVSGYGGNKVCMYNYYLAIQVASFDQLTPQRKTKSLQV